MNGTRTRPIGNPLPGTLSQPRLQPPAKNGVPAFTNHAARRTLFYASENLAGVWTVHPRFTFGASTRQSGTLRRVFLPVLPSPSTSLNGWEVSGQYKFTDWLGGVADISGHYGSISGVGTSTYTYLFGPQVSLPARVSPFGHLLLGGAHNSTAGFGNSSFSMALGGGIDTEITDRFHWRMFQTDYLLTQFGGRSQNNFRFSTGIIIRF